MGERRGKRIKRYKRQKRQTTLKIMRLIIAYIIIGILGYMAYGFYREARIKTAKEKGSSLALEEGDIQGENNKDKSIEDTKQSKKQELEFTKVSAEYDGYLVDCRLEIPKIKLNTNVLTDYTKAGLEICASKYYGPNANEVGNYCIAGHNYKKKNMFNHLIDLKIGDSLFLTDNMNGKVEYTIYDIYRVKPENIEPLSQETRGEKEVTLITCVNYSTKRLVVKAIEKKV